MNKFTKLQPRFAAPSSADTIEMGPGGLPLVQFKGLNTNKATNLSGLQVDTSGNLTTPGAITATGGVTNAGGTVTGPTGSFGNLVVRNIVTGPTGSFGALQITSANASGATGTTAALGPVGAADGGPATASQNGWAVVYVAGVKCWVPVWV